MYYATYCSLNVPVSASARQVIRAARLRIRKKDRENPRVRAVRKEFYTYLLKHHADAQALAMRYRL